jgi:hypothetical protein
VEGFCRGNTLCLPALTLKAELEHHAKETELENPPSKLAGLL